MGKIEEVETIYSQGTAEYREDGLIYNPPFFGVIDGFSAVYSPINPIELFDGQSGGERVRQIIIDAFNKAAPTMSLEGVLLIANQAIAAFQKDVSLEAADERAGASFVAAKIGDDAIEIIQGGDCGAVRQFDGGYLGWTENQCSVLGREDRFTLEELMIRYGQFPIDEARKRAWIDFDPILRDRRCANQNKRYAVLDGNPVIKTLWQKCLVSLMGGLTHLILFSDGLLSPSLRDDLSIVTAGSLLESYEVGGSLRSILNKTRILELERERAKSSYITHSEATGIAISFK